MEYAREEQEWREEDVRVEHQLERRTIRTQADSKSTADVDIRVRVSGGGHTSQVYAIRQAIAKSIVRAIPTENTECCGSLTLCADRLLPEVRR